MHFICVTLAHRVLRWDSHSCLQPPQTSNPVSLPMTPGFAHQGVAYLSPFHSQMDTRILHSPGVPNTPRSTTPVLLSALSSILAWPSPPEWSPAILLLFYTDAKRHVSLLCFLTKNPQRALPSLDNLCTWNILPSPTSKPSIPCSLLHPTAQLLSLLCTVH